MALRPYWSGHIRLSLVSLSVNIYLALDRARTIAFHEIYKPTGERVHHQLVAGDKDVDREDIVKGYEVKKGDYVLIDPAEIKALKIPSSDTLDIVEFVEAGAVDPIYFENPYYVAPAARGDQATFAVMRDAMRDTGRIGIGQLAIGGRERLCALRPCGSGMMIETLRYEDEIRACDPYFDAIRDKSPNPDELDLARELIKRRAATFDAGKFHDHYREALQELIDARAGHREPRPVEANRSAAKVVNLMDALRASLKDDAPKPRKTSKPKTSKPKTVKARPVPRKKAG